MSSKEALGAAWETEGYPCNMGSYVLLRSLARGGMGEVHLAKHGGLAGIQKYCVVKTLKRFATSDEEYVRRFVDEARVVVSLQHKNICPVFDVGRVQGRYYLAMELITGRDLRGLIAGAATLGLEISPALAMFIVGEVLEALDYAHRARDPNTGELLHLVHRDISPQNVMLSYEGEVKLIDFGLAASTLKQERTNPNIVMGKLAYMPPEQLDGKDVDGRADLFAAGVMLYELLAKDRFYAGMSDGEILVAASNREFEPRKLNEIEPALQQIVRDALNPDRTQRLPDCGEFKDRLVRYQVERRMTVTTRDLRRMIEKVFPADPEKTRAMLAQYAAQRAPTRDEDADAIATSSSGVPPDPNALKGIEELQGMSDDMMAAEAELEVDLEAELFGDLHDDEKAPAGSTPIVTPGREPQPAAFAAATEREPTEPTRDVHLSTPMLTPLSIAPAATPSESAPLAAHAPIDPIDPFANVPTSAGATARIGTDATVVIPRRRTGETGAIETAKSSPSGNRMAVGLVLLLLAVGAFLATRGGAGGDTTTASLAGAPAPSEAATADAAPTSPAAADTAPTEVAPAEPAAADAGAAAPSATDPSSTDPSSTDLAATELASTDLAAAEAPPVDPAPEDPAPAGAETASGDRDPAAAKQKGQPADSRAAAAAKKRRARAARLKRVREKRATVAWKPTTGSAAPKTGGALPKLRAGARPEGKIRYLEIYCGSRAKCASKLVGDFRGMRVSNAKTFWANVDACVMICSPGSLQ